MTYNKSDKSVKKRGRVVIITPPHYILESLYLGAISENSDYETFVKPSDNYNKLFNFILDSVPNYLVSKITFEKFRTQMDTLSRLKERLPQTKFIVYGEPFLTYNNNVTYENPFIDYVITGEAEETLADILEGVPDCEILGICYTDDNMQSVKNELRPFIENLDKLPFPARYLVKNLKCNEIEVSRGCPYNCLFCLSTSKHGAANRLRSPNNILEEINICKNEYGIKNFNFKSDIFNFDNNWVKELCDSIIKNNQKITWSCDIVPKNIDEELVKLMYKAGCRTCRIGAESGSVEILGKIDKDITKESISKTVALLKKHRICTNVFFLIGLPWETEKNIAETIDFALKLDSDNAIFNTPIPFPPTKLFVYSILNKLFMASTENRPFKNIPICNTHTIKNDKILELCNYAEKRFYSTPKKVLKRLIDSLQKAFIKLLKINQI